MIKRLLSIALVAAALAAAPLSGAARAGDNKGNVLVKVYAGAIITDNDWSGPLDGKVNASDEFIPTMTITAFVTDNIALEMLCCFSKHSFNSRLGGGKLADTWIFPPTISLQYHQQIGAFKPYVGVGVGYIHFFSETGFSDLNGDGAPDGYNLSDTWALALGGGLDVALGGGWQLSVDFKKFLGVDADLAINGQHVDQAHLDPWLISAGVGYRFNFCDLLGTCSSGG